MMGGKQLVNKVLVLLVIAAVAGAALGGLRLLPPGDAYASGHSATRSFSATSVAPGEMVTVTIVARDYGNLGRIVETVPSGFTTSDGKQTVTIRLLSAGPKTETYTVTATDNPGPHTFSGTISDQRRDSRPVVGLSRVTITAPPSDPEPTAVRTISPASVNTGDEFTVSIRANNYGKVGRIMETLPAGFTSSDADGQTVTLRLLSGGPQTVNYRVTAPQSAGNYDISGKLQAEDKQETDVGGQSRVTVTAVDASAVRSFSPATVAPGGTVNVSIRADNYGRVGRIIETLPSGFSSEDADGQTVTIRLLQAGPQTVRYTVTAPETTDTYTFRGFLEDEDKNRHVVVGAAKVTVRKAARPPSNMDPRFSETAPTRSIAENSAGGSNVGAPVTATDRDGDTLAYTLSGADAASFSIGRNSGQITVGAGTMLDFETKPSYSVRVTARDGRGGSDTIAVAVAVTNVEEQGTVTLNPERPLVGTALTASLTDPDGGVTGETWQWSRSDTMDGTFTGIEGAARASYTPVEADYGMYLKTTVTYTDGHGPNKTATAGAMVSDPLVARYDANNNGTIERSEVIRAINDYLFDEGDVPITRPEVIRLINLYLFPDG